MGNLLEQKKLLSNDFFPPQKIQYRNLFKPEFVTKIMTNKTLENKAEGVSLVKTTNEKAYLNSMMPEVRQEGYTCVTGCTSCVSCGGNDYTPRKK